MVPERPAWMADGACNSTDLSLFFPERGDSVTAAKAICAACTVRDTCREYALDHGIKHGIWGGTSERDRRRIRRQRNLDRR